MKKEQIQELSKLQNEIDNLEQQINNFYYQKTKDSDGNIINTPKIQVVCYNSKYIELRDYLPESRCLAISKLIINSIEAELELLKAERDSYILSKPI